MFQAVFFKSTTRDDGPRKGTIQGNVKKESFNNLRIMANVAI